VKLHIQLPLSQDWEPLVWENARGEKKSRLHIENWMKAMRTEEYRAEHKRPFSSYLPFHYHRVPRNFRRLASSFYTFKHRHTATDQFPASFLNIGSELVYRAWHTCKESRPLVLLSHDIESAEGFSHALTIAKLEEHYGFRSVWNIIPKLYPINETALQTLLDAGHEIGLHGIWHNNRETFLPATRMRSELKSLDGFRRRFQIRGYRSPSWYRPRGIYPILREFFSYDMSALDCDLLCPAGKGGVGFHRPYKDESGLLHITCNIPFEAPLLTGIRPENWFPYWRPKLDFIREGPGVAVINTHPEREYIAAPRALRSYEELLRYFASRRWNNQLPRDLLGEEF
jgi:peptidoglycan/xylan/chitin deacetylase (PgdA/CDA1 family)